LRFDHEAKLYNKFFKKDKHYTAPALKYGTWFDLCRIWDKPIELGMAPVVAEYVPASTNPIEVAVAAPTVFIPIGKGLSKSTPRAVALITRAWPAVDVLWAKAQT
jgi:hypothetical protein